MKRIALALALSLFATFAHAQCNGVFPNNTVCGNVTGSGNLPRATSPSAFLGAAGGTNGQIQYNNAGALGGLSQVDVPRGGTGVASFTANLPILGNGAGNLIQGTRSGNTTQFATSTGTLTNGNCVKFDANGNLADAGFACSPTSVSGFTGPTICNLYDQMNSHYGVGGWSFYTTAGTGTDIGPALAECITTFASYRSRGIIYVPSRGTWALSTANTDVSGAMIQGDGSIASLIVFQSSTGAAFWWKGTGGKTWGGIKGISMLLDSTIGASSATAYLFQGDATNQPDQCEMDDIYTSSLGGSTWNTGLSFNGELRTSPQGIRICDIRNVQLFQNTNAGASFRNVVGFTITNLGVYTGSGTGNTIFISGGGTASTNSIQITMMNVISTDLNVTNASRFFLFGWGSTVTVATSATKGIIWYQGSQVGTCGSACTVNTF